MCISVVGLFQRPFSYYCQLYSCYTCVSRVVRREDAYISSSTLKIFHHSRALAIHPSTRQEPKPQTLPHPNFHHPRTPPQCSSCRKFPPFLYNINQPPSPPLLTNEPIPHSPKPPSRPTIPTITAIAELKPDT